MEIFNKIILANDGIHKYKIILKKDGKKVKTIKFGAIGYEHYTSGHLDEDRKKLYEYRHKKNEKWNDETSKGYYSYNFLWRFKTYNEAKKFIYNDLKRKNYS
jgi:hypothetical protein